MNDSLDTGLCATEGRSWESRVPSSGESKREQQFYSYYGPFRRMSKYGPVFCDVRDPVARKQHKPVSCPDKTLTALCQLGALRMNAKRCLIFFFDINHAYIMAESTRSLSLEHDNVHEPGDQIWCESPVGAVQRKLPSVTRIIFEMAFRLATLEYVLDADYFCSGSFCSPSRRRLLRSHRQPPRFPSP